MSNENLRLARQVKNDEFYTRYEDIEKELIRYKEQFKDNICLILHERMFRNGIKRIEL